MMPSIPSLATVLLFTFGFSVFYVLLAIERRVWGLSWGRDMARYDEQDIRFVHQSLKRLIPVLPPSNGIVVVGGLAALIWQSVQRQWDGPTIAVLA